MLKILINVTMFRMELIALRPILNRQQRSTSQSLFLLTMIGVLIFDIDQKLFPV